MAQTRVEKLSVSLPEPLVKWLRQRGDESSLSTVLTQIVREAREAHERQQALGKLLRALGPISKPTTAEQAEIDAELGIER
jgi:hypothetical protein